MQVRLGHLLHGERVLVSFDGVLDAADAPTVRQLLVDHLMAAPGGLVIDLSGLELLSADAAAELAGLVEHHRSSGTTVIVVAVAGLVMRVLDLPGRFPSEIVVSSLEAAVDRLGVPGADRASSEELDIRQLRNRAYVAQALRLLQDRYRLADPAAAFALPRDASQHHNVKVQTLAGALLSVRAPRGATWFPCRRRWPAPALPFTPAGHTPTDVLIGALDAVLGAAGGGRG